MNRQKLKTYASLFLLGAISGCSPATEFTASWKNPDLPSAPITKILVTVMTGNTESQHTLENDLALAISEKGYEVVRGQEIFSPGDSLATEAQRNAFLENLTGRAVDAILTVAILNDDTDNRFVPGPYNYEPIQRFEYYRGFWEYLGERQPTINTPGFNEEDNVYFLETNLYDAKSEELLWSAQSESYSPGNMTAVTRDFATALISRMEDDGVLRRD